MTVDVLLEDEFYAKTPDLDKTFPPSNKAKWTVVEQKDTRSTLEELPIEEEKQMKKLLKKILQWISQNPPKYKFVFVLWEDANSDSSWNELSTIEQMLPTICISVGFLINKTEDAFILASDFTTDEKMAGM